MRNLVICIVLTPLAVLLAHCIDANPSTFPNVDGGRFVRPDASRDTADDVDPRDICRACLGAPQDPGPGCSADLAACMADDQCAIIYECGFRLDCWSLPDQMNIVSCGIPCFTEAGIKTFGEPAIMLSTAVMNCVLGACHPACGVGP